MPPLTDVKIAYSRHEPHKIKLYGKCSYDNAVQTSRNGTLVSFGFIHHTG